MDANQMGDFARLVTAMTESSKMAEGGFSLEEVQAMLPGYNLQGLSAEELTGALQAKVDEKVFEIRSGNYANYLGDPTMLNAAGGEGQLGGLGTGVNGGDETHSDDPEIPNLEKQNQGLRHDLAEQLNQNAELQKEVEGVRNFGLELRKELKLGENTPNSQALDTVKGLNAISDLWKSVSEVFRSSRPKAEDLTVDSLKAAFENSVQKEDHKLELEKLNSALQDSVQKGVHIEEMKKRDNEIVTLKGTVATLERFQRPWYKRWQSITMVALIIILALNNLGLMIQGSNVKQPVQKRPVAKKAVKHKK